MMAFQLWTDKLLLEPTPDLPVANHVDCCCEGVCQFYTDCYSDPYDDWPNNIEAVVSEGFVDKDCKKCNEIADTYVLGKRLGADRDWRHEEAYCEVNDDTSAWCEETIFLTIRAWMECNNGVCTLEGRIWLWNWWNPPYADWRYVSDPIVGTYDPALDTVVLNFYEYVNVLNIFGCGGSSWCDDPANNHAATITLQPV